MWFQGVANAAAGELSMMMSDEPVMILVGGKPSWSVPMSPMVAAFSIG